MLLNNGCHKWKSIRRSRSSFGGSDYTGSEWKLTLLDSSRSFTANVNGQTRVSALAGESLQIAYSGAQTGDNEYVSALLCDDDGNVLCYGNIAQNSANGTATLNIPSGLAVGSYTLKIFPNSATGIIRLIMPAYFRMFC